MHSSGAIPLWSKVILLKTASTSLGWRRKRAAVRALGRKPCHVEPISNPWEVFGHKPTPKITSLHWRILETNLNRLELIVLDIPMRLMQKENFEQLDNFGPSLFFKYCLILFPLFCSVESSQQKNKTKAWKTTKEYPVPASQALESANPLPLGLYWLCGDDLVQHGPF